MAAALANAFGPPDPNCIQDAIMDASQATGLDLSDFGDPWVQIVGTPNADDPGGMSFGETELNLSAPNSDITTLVNSMCGLGFYNNNQCANGAGNTPLVGPPHKIANGTPFQGNFRSPGLINALQVNTYMGDNGDGDIQIDVDAFNPAATPILGLLMHGILQVLPNMITGGDNTYGCAQPTGAP